MIVNDQGRFCLHCLQSKEYILKFCVQRMVVCFQTVFFSTVIEQGRFCLHCLHGPLIVD